MAKPRFISLVTAAAFASAVSSAACSGGGFDACEESRTCADETSHAEPPSSAESGGEGGDAGQASVEGGAGGVGGTSGSASGGRGHAGTAAGGTGQGGMSDGAAGEGGLPPGNEPPRVTTVEPADLKTGVERGATITIEFSEPMDASTITKDFIQVFDAGREVEGTLGYAGSTATFNPTEPLSFATSYVVSVSASVTDLEGAPMLEDFASYFSVRDGTWGSVTRLQGASAELGPTEPAIGADGEGNVLVVWHERTASTVIDKIAARWHRNGAWQAESSLDNTDLNVAYPSVAVNEKGDAIAVWIQNAQQIYARQYRNGAWEPAAALIAEDFGSTAPPGVAISPTGEAHVVFNSWSGALRVRATDSSGAWKASAQIASSSRPYQVAPAFSFDASGNGFVAWRGRDAQNLESISVASYPASAGVWTLPAIVPGSPASTTLPLSPGGSVLTPPAIAADANGGAMIAWVRQNGSTLEAGSDFVMSRFVTGEGWTIPGIVSTSRSIVTEQPPALVFDGHDFVAGWIQSDGAALGVHRRTYAEGAWGPAIAVDSDAIMANKQPRLGCDARGNALLVWMKSIPGPTAAWAFDYARFTSDNSSWSAPQRLSDKPQNSPLLAVGAGGTAVVAWLDRTSTEFIDVRAMLFE